MHKVLKILFFIYSCFLSKSYCQKTEINSISNNLYHKALNLYENKAYGNAQNLFQKVSKTTAEQSIIKSNSDFYIAMCAIKLNQTNAGEQLLNFIENNPNAYKKDRALYNIGNYYFSNKKASHALKWYTKIDLSSLSISERDQLNYKMAYSYLVNNYFKEAKLKFSSLLANPRYGNDARYYYGYISYKQENFNDAETNLSKLANNATYQSKANYYVLDIAFKNGDFAKAVEIGKKALKTSERGQKSDIVKIIGESYFYLGKYQEAISYLLQYKGVKGKWNNTDYYYVGFAYFKLDDFLNAEKYFTKIIDGNNKIAQNAYYHLGKCYLHLDKKPEALNAFKNASEMDYDTNIAADASLNYTKLSYEQGNPYQNVSDVLQEYLTKYPESKENEEIRSLLISSFLHQKDFQGAIDFLNKEDKKKHTDEIQEISLYRGMQLFNDKKIEAAKSYLTTASESEKDTIVNQAKFWLAESNYLLGNYDMSSKLLKSIDEKIALEEFKNLQYNLGYALFKAKKYAEAGIHFKKQLTKNNDNHVIKEDATNRLGDCYYAIKEYKKAINTYSIIIEKGEINIDYALYQKAMSNGLIGNNSEKTILLKKILTNHKKSNFADDALFQLALTYSSLNDYTTADFYYEKLLHDFPTSNYIPNVLLRQGLLRFDNNQYQKALLKFKKVANLYPNSSEAKQAVSNAKNVYIETGNIDEYVTWVKTLSFVNITDQEIDDNSYLSVENKFLENDFITAIKGYTAYINKFKNGRHLLKACFYLAQSYLRIKQEKNAIEYLNYVVNQEKNGFTEKALVQLSEIYLTYEKWKDAIHYLKKLEENANLNQNILFAQSNLMKSYYELADYSNAKKYAEIILSNLKVDPAIYEDAKIIIARSSIKTDDFITAKEYYEIINENATGKMKAETLYYKAFFLNEEELYQQSNEEVQNLIANYSKHKYWGVKSYIIMAKNYYKLKDSYQATYILENIVKNFSQFPELVEEAKNELRTIKIEEAKTNESVDTNK